MSVLEIVHPTLDVWGKGIILEKAAPEMKMYIGQGRKICVKMTILIYCDLSSLQEYKTNVL